MAWKVTGQYQTNRPDPFGRFTSGMQVAFTTDSGISGDVFVPDAQYAPDMVKQVIMARIAQLDGVSNLTG